MNNPFFAIYIYILRSLGISKHTEKLGICSDCMEKYLLMQNEYKKKQITYGVFGIIIAAAYFSLTSNIFSSMLIAAILFSFSLFSYCPALAESETEK
jgi:hypothetical protein